ncbi:violaxanthin deepoxidase [Chloropicon primus]|uniref:Violaxanthin deepoxidase n=1 Tax=Chloropicon primus TaxID=1764295 RepID=A0A5B8MB41_9CHLO|nr:violaxanthin deepoxidase [Chloropicon primus]UPQ96884.1 violaxanthin deepoxidase [Chloropicon primus]|eukprot:QDZ17668.1 violaxanthin deepoxidase [Chloropicon primus]
MATTTTTTACISKLEGVVGVKGGRCRGRKVGLVAGAAPRGGSPGASTSKVEGGARWAERFHGWKLAGLGHCAAVAVLTMGVHGSPSVAADFAKTGGCVLSKCQLELASCLGDEKCLENLVCLNSCTKCPPEEEAGCQIKCGDLYNDKAIAAFNTCAVTNKSCVPQKMDNGMYMEPSRDVLVPEFDTRSMEGRWYITAGLNPLFDTFDCQEHYFTAPESGKLYAKLKWRVKKPNGQFIERGDVQTFVQDAERPGILLNHDNEFLHYQDDWFILGMEPDKYVAVYYRGSNDAWDGYGGAVVYTREPALPKSYVPMLTNDFSKVGLKFDDFALTDNTCGPEPKRKIVRPPDIDTFVEDVQVIQDDLKSFGRGFTVIQNDLNDGRQKLSNDLRDELKRAEDALAQVEKRYASKLSFLDVFRTTISSSS